MFDRVDPLRDALGRAPRRSRRWRLFGFVAAAGLFAIVIAAIAGPFALFAFFADGDALEPVAREDSDALVLRTRRFGAQAAAAAAVVIVGAAVAVAAIRRAARPEPAPRFTAPRSRRQRYRGPALLALAGVAVVLFGGSCLRGAPVREQLTLDSASQSLTAESTYIGWGQESQRYAYDEIEAVGYRGASFEEARYERGTVWLALLDGSEVDISEGLQRYATARTVAAELQIDFLCEHVRPRRPEDRVTPCRGSGREE